MQCIAKMEIEAARTEAKMELSLMCRKLMPGGKADLLAVVQYPKLSTLIAQHGEPSIMKVVFCLVKDFCNSLNVVRNMNEEQMIEAASMLIEECGNFRLEDYVQMFQLAKRGNLVKVYDRIDLQVITEMLDEYWKRRKQAADILESAKNAEYLSYEHFDFKQRSAEDTERHRKEAVSFADQIKIMQELKDR